MDETMDKTVSMTLVKSMAGRPRKQRAVLVGLGLTRMSRTVTRKDTPEIRGMLRKIQHLVRIEE